VSGLQEHEELLERTDVVAPGDRPDAPLDERGDHRVHVGGGQLPRRLDRQCQEPLEDAGAGLDRGRAEAAGDLAGHEAVDAARLEDNRVDELGWCRKRRRALDGVQVRALGHRIPSVHWKK